MTIKQKYTILFILGGLSALAPFSIDMYLPAFPSIATSLKTDISQVALSLTSYFAGISIGQLFYGPITDKFGRKKPLVFGLTLFLLASVGCALSPTINWLIGMRVLLALGGCVGMVVSRAVVRDQFPVTEIAKIFSILMLITGVAPIVAPTIGGWIITVSTWRTIFYFLTAFSFILILAVWFYLPESKNRNRAKSLHVVDIVKDYRDVFAERSFIFYILTGSMALAGMFAYISGSPFIFLEYFDFTEAQYGLVFAGNAGGFILGSQLNRLALNRYTSLQVITVASWLMLADTVALFTLMSLGMLTASALIVLLVTFLFSMGFLVPNTTAMALAPFTYNAGSASALIGFMQMICGAGLSALVSALHDNTLFPMVFAMSFSGILAFMLILLLNYKVKQWHKLDDSENKMIADNG
jgi:DHA1 family bicyclomycin/chloramphenicol resistance-like MFS transporter